MNAADIIDLVEAHLPGSIASKNLTAIDPYLVVEPNHLLAVARFLRDDERLRFDLLNSICGVDYLEIDPKKVAKAGFEPHLEVVYHLSSFGHRHRFTFKVMLPRWHDGVVDQLPSVPTVTALWATADWHERETYDMFGISFTNHPDLRRILLAEDWVGYPLRKDYEYPLEYHAIRCR